MRPILLLAGVVIVCGIALLAAAHAGEPAKEQTDPWAGAYVRHYQGANGENQLATITLTKGTDGYYLSKPYERWKFTEVEKGVVSNGKGGLGRILLGEAKFADGTSVRVLRADFCYEQFTLYDERPRKSR